MRPTIENFVGDNAIFDGFIIEEGTGDVINTELGLTAFIKSRNEGSDYYKSIFVDMESVHRSIEYQKGLHGGN